MLIASIDAFVALLVLGTVAVRFPETVYDVTGARLRGGATRIAIVFTQSGRSRQLAALLAVAFVIFAVARWPLWIPLAVALEQLVSQAVVEAIKRVFRRVRPDRWLHREERGYSYPSGHASTAVTFYGAWAAVAWLSPLPLYVRLALTTLLVLWGLGVAWSRLALAAHYLTDVLGGVLFGLGWLLLVFTLLSKAALIG
ncbi:MAG TPA: phosphatase PAP2 family protein [Candidatus Aquilonibacter sp.]|nr:phosphatase PAP2 family protein [Candidatus Aquilonibacter sp.]